MKHGETRFQGNFHVRVQYHNNVWPKKTWHVWDGERQRKVWGKSCERGAPGSLHLVQPCRIFFIHAVYRYSIKLNYWMTDYSQNLWGVIAYFGPFLSKGHSADFNNQTQEHGHVEWSFFMRIWHRRVIFFVKWPFPALDVSPFALGGFGMGFLATDLTAQVEALLELEPNIYWWIFSTLPMFLLCNHTFKAY